MKEIKSFLAITLTLVFVAPIIFLAVPYKVAAALPVIDVANSVHNTLDKVIQISTEIANVAEKINTYVFEPLAFVLSGEILKAITGGIISFVIGEANGTGVPQFVVDVQESLRTVSDSHALAFIRDFGEHSNSPFASSIRLSIEDEYFSKTSLAGFWARNMSTLRQSSRFYTDDYLRGDWRRGGIHSWFALTIRTENNPYLLHQESQRQLQGIVGSGAGGATGARLEELKWGNGFMSWCGGAFGEDYDLPEEQETSHPGDDCIDKVTGETLKIKTPGTVIADALNRAFSSEQEKIVRMGNVGPQVNEILGNIATVLQTVEFAKSVLGGSGSGGLAGIRTTTSSNTRSSLSEYTDTPGFLGATQSGVYQSGSGGAQIGTNILSRTDQYESAWKSIETSANSASVALNDLKISCPDLAPEADAALTGPVASVLTQVNIALNTVATTRATVSVLQAEISASDTSTTENPLPRIQDLDALTPTTQDLSDTITKLTSFVDQMELLSANALARKENCSLL